MNTQTSMKWIDGVEWVLVPREPTEAMRRAIYIALHFDMSVQNPDEWGAVDKAYSAMLAALPGDGSAQSGGITQVIQPDGTDQTPWKCRRSDCGQLNSAWAKECGRCEMPKPATTGQVPDGWYWISCNSWNEIALSMPLGEGPRDAGYRDALNAVTRHLCAHPRPASTQGDGS